MSPASPDGAGDALVQAFAAHGYHVTLEQSDVGRLIVKDRLRVRLLPENALDTPPDLHELVTPLAPGLLQAVVVNYTDSAMMLNRSSLGDTSENEVFVAALRTSIDKEPSDLHPTEVSHVPITQIGEAQRYVGAHVHVMRTYLGTAPWCRSPSPSACSCTRSAPASTSSVP